MSSDAAPAVPATAYVVRELHASDELTVLALLQAALAGGPTGERTPAFLRWKHQQNPFGPSPGLVAVAPDGTLAAVRLLMRWTLLLSGRTVSAVRAVDTATHPDHQGRGLFRRLTLQALDTVAADADLVFNTPNANSRPGYLRMGWQDVGALPVRIRPVRLGRFARGVRRSGQAAVEGPSAPLASPLVRAKDLFDARPDEVASLIVDAESAADQDRLRTPRTIEYMRWRFVSVPGLDYRTVVVDDADGLRALGLGRLRRRGPLVELTLGEVLTRPGDAGAAGAVLAGAARAGVDHVALHAPSGSPLSRAAGRRGYCPVPGRGLRLVVNPRRPLTTDPTRPSSWALTLGDLEVF